MNMLTNVSLFIEAWDSINKTNDILHSELIKKSPLNNINLMGDTVSDTSIIFTKNDQQFYDVIENGVKDLVHVLIDNYNWITYSSCEGHVSNVNTAYKKRMVQLLPRNNSEKSEMVSVLMTASLIVNEKLRKTSERSIKIDIIEEILNTESQKYETVKILFSSNGMNEQEYFESIKPANSLLIKQLI